jgi:hypothetical protein
MLQTIIDALRIVAIRIWRSPFAVLICFTFGLLIGALLLRRFV